MQYTTFDEVREYLDNNNNIYNLWVSYLKRIANLIQYDDNWLEKHYSDLKYMLNENEFLDKLANDAINAKLFDEYELDLFPDVWFKNMFLEE